ncbi:hypothetical protein [Streptomyces radicis]|uniref:Uncharacterized protein n=1 Tax=Streptomyces radicis TaxID=1750517 RepID=A0A3A9WXH4_9ACTN|nr:hypothetical protein [Streptomyces radicis]RKN10877.1 hypothetical protein D7319_06920 [Streptomyces radicis]RKN25141.1 hypothetical protein D7318_07775 [Streptomyces radicis]
MVNSGFPDDLVRDQHAWNHTYQRLVTCRPEEYTVLRRRLLHLSCRIAYHPHWAGHRSAASWAELRHDTRRHEVAQRLARAV